MKPSPPVPTTLPRTRNRAIAIANIGLAAGDLVLARRHAASLRRSLAELGDRAHAHAVTNIVERLDRALGSLADA